MPKEPRKNPQPRPTSGTRRRKNEPAPDQAKIDDRPASMTPPGAGLPEFGGPAAPPPGLDAEWEPTVDDIGRRAYEIYEGRGRQPGRDLDDWLEAEDELRRKRERQIR